MVKLGQEVATLFDGMHQPGNYEAIFNGGELASSIYLYRLTANDFVETKKLILTYDDVQASRSFTLGVDEKLK
jgi:hypothetical protein